MASTTSQARAPRIRRWGNQGIAFIFGLIGIVCIGLSLPHVTLISLGGVLLLLLGFGIQRKYFTCGACGNEVARTSKMCPSCHSQLYRRLSAGETLVLVCVPLVAVITGVCYLILRR